MLNFPPQSAFVITFRNYKDNLRIAQMTRQGKLEFSFVIVGGAFMCDRRDEREGRNREQKQKQKTP